VKCQSCCRVVSQTELESAYYICATAESLCEDCAKEFSHGEAKILDCSADQIEYEVPVIYRGQCNFIVRATSKEQAGEKAKEWFKNGYMRVDLGNEWEEFDRLGEINPVDTGGVASTPRPPTGIL